MNPSRVVYNFASSCNMACRYCYVPFVLASETLQEAGRVLERILAWQVDSVTFGGGDPLMLEGVEALVDIATRYQPKPFIQLDTNGLGNSLQLLRKLARSVDLIGLPLDSLSPATNEQMRKYRNAGAHVARLVEEGGLPHVKINTVVARPNIADLIAVGNLIARSEVAIWSLYQFWAIGERAIAARDAFEVSDEQFSEVAEGLRRTFPELHIEVSSASDRYGSYCFVTPTGRAYTVDSRDPSRYLELGNILSGEDRVLDAYSAHVDAAKNYSRAEGRSLVLGKHMKKRRGEPCTPSQS